MYLGFADEDAVTITSSADEVTVDACNRLFLSVNLIRKFREFAFFICILVQNNDKTKHALEKYAMLEIEQK